MTRKAFAAFVSLSVILCPSPAAWASEFEFTDRLTVTGDTLFQGSTTWRSMATPSVSASGYGALFFNSGTHRFNLSENGDAYAELQQQVTGTCAAGSVVNQINEDGTVVCGSAIPAGGIVLSTTSCPSGFEELLSFKGRFAKGTPAGGTVTTTVGTPLTNLATMSHDHSYTPAGNVSAPTFTGTPGNVNPESAHTHGFTPAGTTAWPAGALTFTGSASATGSTDLSHTHTAAAHSHTWPDLGGGVTTGANSDGTHAHSWPGAVGGADTGNQSAGHTHSLTATGSVSSSFAGSAGTSSTHASHTHTTGGPDGTNTVAWATGATAWVATTGHTHVTGASSAGYTHSHTSTPVGSVSSTFSGTSAASDTGSNHTHHFNQSAGSTDSTGTHTHNVAQNAQATSSDGALQTGGASASQNHSHSYTPAGTIAYPAGTPSFAGSAGASGGGSAHQHGVTPTGTVAAPTFTGSASNVDSASSTPPYLQVLFCLKL